MITKRDIAISIITALVMCIPLAIVVSKEPAKDLPSAAFDWNTITVTTTKTGERRQFFQSPTATLDELECHVTTLNPGEIPHAPHQHPEEELMIIKEGTVEALVNGETKRLGPGSVIFQASNQLHGLKNIGTTRATYHVFKWKSAKAR